MKFEELDDLKKCSLCNNSFIIKTYIDAYYRRMLECLCSTIIEHDSRFFDITRSVSFKEEKYLIYCLVDYENNLIITCSVTAFISNERHDFLMPDNICELVPILENNNNLLKFIKQTMMLS